MSDATGFPLMVNAFEGNTTETTTMLLVLKLFMTARQPTDAGIQLGGGEFDSLTAPGINSCETTFETNGIPFTTDMVTGGHEWYTWRQLLYNFLTTAAFQHPAGTP